MQSKPLLVTGATGSTGSKLVAVLRSQGHPVRALVHREDARSSALQALGASVVVGDLRDFDLVRQATVGARGAYFVLPIAPGLVEATAYFAQAAKEAGVESVVNMSQISARSEARSRAARNHWMAERVFDWSGLAVTHVRPTFFAEWFLYYAHDVQAGVVRLPFGTGRHAPIAAADQARFIAAVLTDPAPHAGKAYPLYGPKEYTYPEAIALLSQVLGRTASLAARIRSSRV